MYRGSNGEGSIFEERIEDTKGVTRSRKSSCNGRQYTTQKTKDRATLKTVDDIRSSGMWF